MHKEKFMIYRRDAKKGEATYSPKSHSTPYFARRNIHFYINRCGFHAVEFFNEHHPDPNMPEQFDQEDGLFKFEKRMIRKKT